MQAETMKRSVAKTETFRLVGLRGQDCVEALNKALASVPGVAQVSVSLSDEKATVTYDTAHASFSNLEDAVFGAGYEAMHPTHGEDGNCCGGCGG
ncbi:MAG: heavy-metal-associated domain-containing protein [Castellaniella sp.]